VGTDLHACETMLPMNANDINLLGEIISHQEKYGITLKNLCIMVYVNKQSKHASVDLGTKCNRKSLYTKVVQI
jgi:hypothetical protein